jgi:20S proteasome alpha/beta subunit
MGDWLDNVADKVSRLGDHVAWAGAGFIAGLLATWLV